MVLKPRSPRALTHPLPAAAEPAVPKVLGELLGLAAKGAGLGPSITCTAVAAMHLVLLWGLHAGVCRRAPFRAPSACTLPGGPARLWAWQLHPPVPLAAPRLR
jgi:hypothetical protein